MRPLGAGQEKHQILQEEQLPSLWISLLPVLLPVILIGVGTLLTTLADREDRAKVRSGRHYGLRAALASLFADAAENTPAGRVLDSQRLTPQDRLVLMTPATDDAVEEEGSGGHERSSVGRTFL